MGRIQPIPDGDVQAAIACGFAGTGTHCLMGIGAAPEGVISAAAMRALGGHFQGQLVYDPAIAQTSEWADYTKEGNIKRLNEMGITDIEVDGGIKADWSLSQCCAAGANCFIAGSGMFAYPSLKEGCDALRAVAEDAQKGNVLEESPK